jgi:hypothetical protein
VLDTARCHVWPRGSFWSSSRKCAARESGPPFRSVVALKRMFNLVPTWLVQGALHYP